MNKLFLLTLLIAGVARGQTIQLFNGKDLSNWTAYFNDKNVKMEDVFTVTDGVIHCKGKAPAGYIRTNDNYTNYDLKVQWRTLKKGNSGVLIRCQEPDKVWPKSVECQLETNNAGDIWDVDNYPIKVDPARTKGRRTIKLHPTNEKPLGEWNQYEIIADGTHLTLKVNDLVQNEATDVAELPGHILLQSEGAEIEFRNIELTPIKKPAANRDQKKQQSMVQAVHELYQLFTPDQQKQLTLPFDSPERTAEVFLPGKRLGIQLKDLSDEQRKRALDLVKSFTSDYGWQKAQAIAKQSHPDRGLEDYYLTFFGQPDEKANFAWRIAEHHLTIVDVEFADGKVHAIGPILVGANPPTLWNDEEDTMIALYKSLAPDEKAKVTLKGKSDSAAPMKDPGVPVSDLGTDAQKQVQAVVDQRLKFFSPDMAQRIKEMIQQEGGINHMNIVFYGPATRRCADGGKWDFKMGAANFLLDYENTRGHIHMSLSAK